MNDGKVWVCKMKVKVGKKVYDGEKEPVMVILTEQDKENIANMLPDAKKYCVYPKIIKWTGNGYEGIHRWMEVKE